jgi:chromate transporter
MNPLLFGWLVLVSSLFSTSGMGNLPSLHRDLLARGWADERAFAESLVIGQIAPGPTGLWVVSLGYLMDGLRGALVALAGIVIPPLGIVLVERLYRRVQRHAAVEGFVRGIGIAVVGVFAVVMVDLLRGNGLDVRSVAIAVAGAGLAASGRVPVLVVLILAAGAGILVYA